LAVAGVGSVLALEACSGGAFSSCADTFTCSGAGSGGQSAGAAGASAGSSGASGRESTSAGGDAGAPGVIVEPGAGGVAGTDEGGAGGQATTPECAHDADCSDHLACNGVETCEEGVCVAGVPPCANPEPAHCDAVCTEVGGAASCTVRGQDKDGDGHFASNCATKPGDDCDDSAATVYTGAPELCDQIDNNCNGKIDMSDGLGPGGTTVNIGPAGATRALPRIAWAKDKSVYGIAYEDSSSSATADLYFEQVGATGAIGVGPEPFNDAQTNVASNPNPSLDLTWGGGAFGAAWATDARVYTRAIGSDGSLTAAAVSFEITAPSRPRLVRSSDGSQFVLYASITDLYGNLISPLGLLGGPTSFAGVAQSFALAASGSSFVVAYSGGNAGGPVGAAALWSSTFATSKSLPTAWDPKLASGSAGFAMVGHPSASSTAWQLSAFKADGSSQCGPVTLPAGFVPASLVATPSGYLVLSSGVVKAQEVLANCSLGVTFSIDAGPATDVNVAAGSAGYGVVWQDTTSATPKRRLFGPHYCD